LCNNLTPFYWMPSAKFDGRPLPLLPFGRFCNEWFKYHGNEPNIEFWNFFANLVRVYPTGPTTVPGIVKTHKSLCNQAALILECIDHGGKANQFLSNVGIPQRQAQNYNLKPTYRAIITIMDQYVDPSQDRDSLMFINIEGHS
ncbi:hypothetical protein BJ875DRAFT_389704, partial [Amylocarpus encephaloides]